MVVTFDWIDGGGPEGPEWQMEAKTDIEREKNALCLSLFSPFFLYYVRDAAPRGARWNFRAQTGER